MFRYIDRDEHFFFVSVCGINRKKFTSVPVKVVDINLHFHKKFQWAKIRLVIIYGWKGIRPETKSDIVFLSVWTPAVLKKQIKNKNQKSIWNGRNETIH